MKISVFGIGYVGAVSAACLSKDGNSVIAVDPAMDKVRAIASGISPILEPGLTETIQEALNRGLLRATNDAETAVLGTDLSLICVGTPSRHNGSLDTAYVLRAAEEIGVTLRKKSSFHSVVVRSTILPGTMDSVVIPALERSSGLTAGVDFGVGYYPEFLRESTAIADYYDPGAIVIGQYKDDVRTVEALRSINKHLPIRPIVVDMRAAEAVKYANNAWHAVKISFSNEIGNICKAAGIDSYQVMDVVCSDTRLNISPVYMKPGFAFGGSCLPKDLRALRHRARDLDVSTPMLDATLEANEYQLERAFDMVAAAKARRVGMVGLSFKSNTDDLRESPLVELAERLHGKGYDLRIYDPNVQYSALTGSNLHFIRSHLPHLSQLLVEDVGKMMSQSDLIILGKTDAATKDALSNLSGDQKIIDLVRIDKQKRTDHAYSGICW